MGNAEYMGKLLLPFLITFKFISAKMHGGPGSKIYIATEDAPAAIGPYTQAVKVVGSDGQSTIYVSGQLGIDPATGMLLDGIVEQTTQSMENIKVILAAAGAEMSDIFDCTCLLADLDDYGTFNEVYASYYAEGEAPARAAFEVARLPKDGSLVEVKCTATTFHV